jgi:hypothetical protein
MRSLVLEFANFYFSVLMLGMLIFVVSSLIEKKCESSVVKFFFLIEQC